MSELTLCKQLDELEAKLPPLAAGIVRVNRAVFARTTRDVERFGEMASSSISAITKAAGTSLRTVNGTAKWAAERTASAAATGARQTVGQAKAQTKIAVEKTAEELEELADEVADELDPSAGPVPAAGDLETKTKTELYDQAQDLDIEGRSTMSKAELVAAIRAR